MQYTVREIDLWPKADDDQQFELADDEILLSSEYRGAKRLVVAIATPTKMTDKEIVEALQDDVEADEVEQCEWVKGDGERCSRDAEDGSVYCWQHPSEDGHHFAMGGDEQ